MAINWNLFPQALQNEREGIDKTFDWSFVTPEVVKGFTRYQALRPEEDVKKANKYKEILKNIKNEDLKKRWLDAKQKEAYNNNLAYWRNDNLKNIQSAPETVGATTLAPVVQPEPSKLTDKVKDAEKDLGKTLTEIKTLGGSGYSPEPNGLGVLADPYKEKYEGPDFGLDTFRNNLTFDEKAYESTPDLRDKWDELTAEQKEQYFTGEPTNEELDLLREGLVKESLGSDYDSYKQAYGIYGTLNPYEQMIEAGKRSSYWDPEIGKIYTDAGEKIRQNNLDIWRAAQENKLNLLKLAQQRLNSDWARPSDLTTIRTLESELDELAKNDPRLGGYLTVKEGSNKTLDDYKKQNANLSDTQGNSVNEDVFFAKLQRGDVYKSLDDLRADPFYKSASPEIKTLLEREWTKNRNAFMKSYNERNTIAVEAASKTPYGDELKETEKLLRELKNIDFDATGDGKDGYKALQILKVLDNAGYKVSQVLNTDPTFQNLRATIKGAKNKSWDELIKSAPEIGSQVLESFAKTVFPMLRDQNIWEGNAPAITNFGKLLRNDVERRYNEARAGARSMITGWEGTSLDPNYDNWYKTGSGWESGRKEPEKKEDGADGENDDAADAGADDKKNGANKTWKHIDFAGLEPPNNDNIIGGDASQFIKNAKKFKKRIVNGQVELYWNGDKFENLLAYDRVKRKWTMEQTPWGPDHPKPGQDSEVNSGEGVYISEDGGF